MAATEPSAGIDSTSLGGGGVCLHGPLLIQRSMLCLRLLFDLVHIQVCNLSVLSVEDLSQFLKSWSSSLNVEEVDEREFDKDPDLQGVSPKHYDR
jgi:hypothetical protein